MSSSLTNIPPSTELPAPSELPQADVLIYDGECSFCRSQVERFHRLDGANRLAFVSLHDPSVRENYPDLSHEQLMEEMVLVDQSGNRHAGHHALQYLTWRLPKLRIFHPLFHIPLTGSLWQAAYKWVAKRRYLIGGRRCDDGVCKID